MSIRFVIKHSLGSIVLIWILSGNISDARANETLIFGTYAFEKPTETVRKIRPILDALETAISIQAGRKIVIRLQVAKNYRSAIRDMIRGKVDFGRLGQAAYIIAKAANRKIEVIAVEGDHAKKSFYSLVVVHERSPITEISDLAGASFAFGNKYSTTGRFLPQAYLANNGITSDLLKRFDYLKRHDQVATAVADGKYDAGAISEWVFKDAIRKGAPLRAIASFSSVTKPWVARAGLPKSVRTLIADALVALQGARVLGNIKKDCFLPGGDSDYQHARWAISENWMFFTRSKRRQPAS